MEPTRAGRGQWRAPRAYHPGVKGLQALPPAWRRPGPWLLLLLALDLALQGWTLARGLDSNPFLTLPEGDALVYWDWAARIAEGRFVEPTPFLSAPLYPWFLGLIRALGGGLVTVYVVQLAMRTLTTWLLYRLGARRFGSPWIGFAAAVAFLFLVEPAFFASRLLNSSLQLLLLTLLLWGFQWVSERRSTGRLALLGFLLGLNVLANPAMELAFVLLPLWLGWRTREAWFRTATAVGVALLTISPATLHNWLATKDSPAGPEFVLVSAQAGVTYAHGNSEGAFGVYHPFPGVAMDRQRQNETAYRMAKEATGEEGWKATSRYFFRRGLEWNLAHPADALRLHFQKTVYLFCGEKYGDLYSIYWEFHDPMMPRPVALPFGVLQTGWLLVPALFGAFLWWRRRGRDALPDVFLLLLPMAVVVVFWYSPRYRLPVVVPGTLLASFGVATLLASGDWFRRGMAALLVGTPILLCAVAHATGFEDPRQFVAEYQYHAANSLNRQKRYHEALPRYDVALTRGYQVPIAFAERGSVKQVLGMEAFQAGDHQEAVRWYREALPDFDLALRGNPNLVGAWLSKGDLLLKLGRYDEAERALKQAVQVSQRIGDQRTASIAVGLLSQLEQARGGGRNPQPR